MARPVSDKEIDDANSPLWATLHAAAELSPGPLLQFGAWNLTHAASSHNATYNDQEFLRLAWKRLRDSGADTLGSDNLAHFLGGSGTPKTLSLAKLFQEDQGTTKAFNEVVSKQISNGEQAYRGLSDAKRASLGSIDDFLKANLRAFLEVRWPDAIDLMKDYGPTNFPFHGFVEIPQGAFLNKKWRMGTGGLTVFWLYAGATNTGGSRQHRVVAWCLKQYKWHPKEERWSQLSHMAAENAKAPMVDTFKLQLPHNPAGKYPIKLGSETIGQSISYESPVGSGQHYHQVTYNAAKEFKLIFPPVERVVPAYAPTSMGAEILGRLKKA